MQVHIGLFFSYEKDKEIIVILLYIKTALQGKQYEKITFRMIDVTSGS